MTDSAACGGASQKTETFGAATGGEPTGSPVGGDPLGLCRKPDKIILFLRSVIIGLLPRLRLN
jgi:hypothetical protein